MKTLVKMLMLIPSICLSNGDNKPVMSQWGCIENCLIIKSVVFMADYRTCPQSNFPEDLSFETKILKFKNGILQVDTRDPRITTNPIAKNLSIRAFVTIENHNSYHFPLQFRWTFDGCEEAKHIWERKYGYDPKDEVEIPAMAKYGSATVCRTVIGTVNNETVVCRGKWTLKLVGRGHGYDERGDFNFDKVFGTWHFLIK